MILVTGANGMVGSYVKEVFAGEKLYLSDVPEMDVTDRGKVGKIFAEAKPQAVIHLAAKTDVDKCETEIDDAYRANALGTMNVAQACAKSGAVMVYISTGGVFAGDQAEPYTEFDEPAPPTVYAKSKYQGELYVKQFLQKYFILRAGWMIGGGKKDIKFVAKMAALLAEKPEVKAVDDKFGTITYARQLVKTIKRLLATELYGTYHVVSGGVCNRYDIALEIARLTGSKARIVPVNSAHFRWRQIGGAPKRCAVTSLTCWG